MKYYLKNRISISLIALLIYLAPNAQETKKTIAIINRADWCYVCQANTEKMMKDVLPVFENTNIRFLVNDLTSDETAGKSEMTLKENKVYEAVKKIKSTGLVLLVDEVTGKLLGKISVAEPADKIIMVIKQTDMDHKM